MSLNNSGPKRAQLDKSMLPMDRLRLVETLRCDGVAGWTDARPTAHIAENRFIAGSLPGDRNG